MNRLAHEDRPIHEPLHSPNREPIAPPIHRKSDRVLLSIASIALVSYGCFGLALDDLLMPGKHGDGVHFHGLPAWIMFIALLCFATSMLSVVRDRYDATRSEWRNRKFTKATVTCGFVVFTLGVVLQVLVFRA